MAKMICTTCDYIYDERFGGPSPNVAPDTLWADLPDTWHCPLCGEPKSGFDVVPSKED